MAKFSLGIIFILIVFVIGEPDYCPATCPETNSLCDTDSTCGSVTVK